MATVENPPAEATTHEVLNQASPLENYNVFEADHVLVEALHREGAGMGGRRVHDVGAFAGSALAQRGAARRTRTRRSSAPTTASATGSTRSSSTPPGTS